MSLTLKENNIFSKPLQTHLNKATSINLGSFYTPKMLVEKAYELLIKHINLKENYVFLDSSCGYGDFFIKNFNYIGADIDDLALKEASKRLENVKFIATNSLENVSRAKFGIKESDKLIIIGNPPYNDKSSIINKKLKKELFSCDERLKFRDLGISFLRSYELLKPLFICVLHPLSYLIKESNFKALKAFKNSYKLIDGIIISSQFFSPKAHNFFPILIALYQKHNNEMTYEYVKNYTFKSLEGGSFALKNFDFIGSYVRKYPNLKDTKEPVALFHTLRDINALKRNKSFLSKESSNSIKVFKENLKYYVYIHFFKKYAHFLPYYYGNLDIFLFKDFDKIALELEKWFYNQSLSTEKIDFYFKENFEKMGVKIAY